MVNLVSYLISNSHRILISTIIGASVIAVVTPIGMAYGYVPAYISGIAVSIILMLGLGELFRW